MAVWDDEEIEAINEIIYASEDMVNAPSHYQSEDGMECWDAIRAQLSDEALIGFCQGNVQKYLWRWKDKGGVDSLLKAQWYLEKMIGIAGHD